jgi:hypothetical protein
MAMRVDAESARAAIRISLGGDTPEAAFDSLLVALGQQVKWLQNASQAAGWYGGFDFLYRCNGYECKDTDLSRLFGDHAGGSPGGGKDV